MKKQSKQKLYCYVDETGQDTKGKLFIVVVVIAPTNRDELQNQLIKREKQSGKRLKKWGHTPYKEKHAYIDSLLNEWGLIDLTLYYQGWSDSIDYDQSTIMTIGQAIRQYATDYQLKNPEATVFVDGLNRVKRVQFRKSLSLMGIQAAKIVGARDESYPQIRLADAVAGFIRDALEGNKNFKSMYQRALKQKIICHIQK